MKLIVLNAAQAELEEAQVYYLQHATPGIAAAFVADYESGARRLLQFPGFVQSEVGILNLRQT